MTATNLDRARVEAALDALADLLELNDDDAERLIGFRGNRIEMSVGVAETLIVRLSATATTN